MKDSLEEAAERFAEKYKGEEQDPWFDFMEGAKWQMERSFTEEEVLEYIGYVDLIHARYHYKVPLSPKEWFKQIKSKQDE